MYVKIKILFLEVKWCRFYILPVKQFGLSFLTPLHIGEMFTNFVGEKENRFQTWLEILFSLTETNNVDK